MMARTEPCRLHAYASANSTHGETGKHESQAWTRLLRRSRGSFTNYSCALLMAARALRLLLHLRYP